MSARAKALHAKIDRLMEEASDSLTAMRYAECERLAQEALQMAHSVHDYETMSRIVLPLQEARRQRRQQASEVKKVQRLTAYAELEPLLTGSKPIKPGCYLIEPPLVGADGRELRERALSEGVSVIVLVREPETRLGQWPIVAVGPATVRARLQPAKKIDVSWLLRACEELGDAAIGLVDHEDCAMDRADHLMELLSTVVDHEKLHQELAQACADAAHELAANPKKRGRPKVLEGEEFEEVLEDEDQD